MSDASDDSKSLLAAFMSSCKVVNVEKLDKQSSAYEMAKSTQDIFTMGVGFLRSKIAVPRVKALAAYVWDVCHHKHVGLVIGPPVQTISFAVIRRESVMEGLIIAPIDWPTMVNEDPLMGLGAIIMIGSQAADYYNGKVESDGSALIKRRAQAYEAELLRFFGDSLKLTPYQEYVLKSHPSFDPALEYPRRPVVGLN